MFINSGYYFQLSNYLTQSMYNGDLDHNHHFLNVKKRARTARLTVMGSDFHLPEPSVSFNSPLSPSLGFQVLGSSSAILKIKKKKQAPFPSGVYNATER